MISGVIVGVVKDNVDPEGMHRVLVEYPVSSTDGKLESTWARICSPMAGLNRGLVILPDTGTEVVLCFSYRSQTSYILGGVYNGKGDKPEPYHNDDEENNLRVFWSRNDSMVIFDDTKGKEKIQIAAKAPERLNTESGIIWQTLDAPEKTYREYSGGDTSWTAMEKISLKCTDFELVTKQSTTMQAGGKIDRLANGNLTFNAGSLVNFLGAQVLRNCGVSASPTEALSTIKEVAGAVSSVAGAVGADGLANAAGGIAGMAGAAGAAGGMAGAAGGMAGAAGGLAGGLQGAAGGLSNAVGGLQGAASGLMGGLSSAADGLAGGLSGGIEGLTGGITGAASGLSSGLTDAAGGLTDAAGGLTNAAGGLTNVAGDLSNAANHLPGDLGNAVGNLSNGLTNAAGELTNASGELSNAAGDLQNAAGGLSSLANSVGGLNPPALDSLIPKLPPKG